MSATESPDKNDPSLPPGKPAATLVNAVVKAYMEVIVDTDRMQRQKRLSDLNRIHTEKELEVRKKREYLKQELEKLGASDDESMTHRTQLAMYMYAEFQREFQRMRSEQRTLNGKLAEAKATLMGLKDAEIPEAEVVMFLNNSAVYRDLQSRLVYLELNKFHPDALAPGTKQSPGPDQTKAAYDATKKLLDSLEDHTRDVLRGAKRIALEADIRHLESQVEVSSGQVIAFEKEVESKREAADSAGHITISAQMAKADIENIERVLRNVAEEEQRLRLDLNSAPRVTPIYAEIPVSPK